MKNWSRRKLISVPIAIAIILFLFTIAFFTSLALYGEDILKKAKLPIISKKQFLEQFFKQYDFELRADFKSVNLTAYDVIIDDKNLEIKLNYSQPRFKNTKR